MNAIQRLLDQADIYSKDIYSLTVLEFYDLVEKACLGELTYQENKDHGFTVYTFADGCKVVLDKGILFYTGEDVTIYTDWLFQKDLAQNPLHDSHCLALDSEWESLAQLVKMKSYYNMQYRQTNDSSVLGELYHYQSCVDESFKYLSGIDYDKAVEHCVIYHS